MRIAERLGKRLFADVPARLRFKRARTSGGLFPVQIKGTCTSGLFWVSDSAGYAYIVRGDRVITVPLSIVF
jgi:hypothetical protein